MSTATGDVRTDERFAHPALFYSGRDEYLAGTLPFIEEGLRDGDPVAVAVPGPNLALLRDALGAAGERVEMLDMTEAGRNPGRIIPGVLRPFADDHPGRHVRIVGEPVWPGRSESEYPACVQHEALINLAFAGRAATILCPYDADNLTPEVLADACASHPMLIGPDGRRPSDRYDPHRIVETYNLPLPEPPATQARTVDASNLGEIRRWVTDRAKDLGLSGERLGDLELAATELATNSVAHGGGTGVVALWPQDGDLVCEVRDSGHITDPLAGRLPPTPSGSAGAVSCSSTTSPTWCACAATSWAPPSASTCGCPESLHSDP